MQLTRQELFEKAWTTPITQLSKALGLSDRGLGKLCARYDIPVPPRGYWARRAAGYTDAVPVLPVSKRAADEPIQFDPKPAAPATPETPLEVEFEQRPENRVSVSAGGPRNKLVRLTATALRGGTADQYGRRWGGPGVLDVRVSKASITRALDILDALVRAAEDRGHRVDVKDKKSVVIVDGEPITFGLDERAIQTERLLREKEKLELARGGYVFGRYSHSPSGELSFHLKDSYWTRNKWSDRKKTKLEDQLNDILAGIAAAAADAKRRRLEREKEAAEWRRQEELRELERERIRQLDEWSKQWHQCQRYRAFLDALKTRFDGNTMPPELSA